MTWISSVVQRRDQLGAELSPGERLVSGEAGDPHLTNDTNYATSSNYTTQEKKFKSHQESTLLLNEKTL